VGREGETLTLSFASLHLIDSPHVISAVRFLLKVGGFEIKAKTFSDFW
jgi:hypothetical protein